MTRSLLCCAVALIQLLLRTESKCVTSFLTTCERVADIPRYAKPTWDGLIIKNSECNNGAHKNNEILTAGMFSVTPNLEQIYIVEKLSSLESGAFSGLKKLRYLKLWGNSVKVLQRGSFANFERIQKLDLTHNSVENLAHQFCENSSVTEIDLSFNALTNIQVDMLNLPSLEVLKISHNQLSLIVPEALHVNLVKLDLRYNRIQSFQEDTLQNLSNLKELLISHNSLKDLPAFAALESLEILDLSHNDIENIPGAAFRNLLELRELYLNSNHFKTLDPVVFSRKLNIETLHLHRNNLTSLSGLVGEALPKLRQITIGANPWFCQCLLEITKYLSSRRIQLTACEKEYLSDGSSPICVSVRADCEKNGGLDEDLYQEFAQATDLYKCDRTI